MFLSRHASGTDGALTLVLNGPDSAPVGLEALLDRLGKLAGRLGMDFVPLLSGNGAAALEILPAEEDWLATAVPLEISDGVQSDHWGLNE